MKNAQLSLDVIHHRRVCRAIEDQEFKEGQHGINDNVGSSYSSKNTESQKDPKHAVVGLGSGVPESLLYSVIGS